jgi:hypothetical protein
MNRTVKIKWKLLKPNVVTSSVEPCCDRFKQAYQSGQIVDIPFHAVGFKDGHAFAACPYCGAPVIEEEVAYAVSYITSIRKRYVELVNQGLKPVRIRMSPHVHADLLEEFRKLCELYPRTLPRAANAIGIMTLIGLPVLIDFAQVEFAVEVQT